jgi:hypothetical protein
VATSCTTIVAAAAEAKARAVYSSVGKTAFGPTRFRAPTSPKASNTGLRSSRAACLDSEDTILQFIQDDLPLSISSTEI